MDFRPFVGLRPRDAGTLIERVIADAVLELVVDAHERDARDVEAASRP